MVPTEEQPRTKAPVNNPHQTDYELHHDNEQTTGGALPPAKPETVRSPQQTGGRSGRKKVSVAFGILMAAALLVALLLRRRRKRQEAYFIELANKDFSLALEEEDKEVPVVL